MQAQASTASQTLTRVSDTNHPYYLPVQIGARSTFSFLAGALAYPLTGIAPLTGMVATNVAYAISCATSKAFDDLIKVYGDIAAIPKHLLPVVGGALVYKVVGHNLSTGTILVGGTLVVTQIATNLSVNRISRSAHIPMLE